jgi:hypothetical protein
VQAVFQEVVQGASDAPESDDAAALGRLLYVVHLAVLLWWLLDKSEGQKTTRRLMAMLGRVLPMAALTLRLDQARKLVRAADVLCLEGLFGEEA